MAAGDVVELCRMGRGGNVRLLGVLDDNGLVCEVRVEDTPEARWRGTLLLGDVEYWLETDPPITVPEADRFLPDADLIIQFTGNR